MKWQKVLSFNDSSIEALKGDMQSEFFQISSSTAYRPVGDKLVVIQAEQGRIYYYNLASRRLFDRLVSPQTRENLLSHFGLNRDSDEARDLYKLVDRMWEQNLLRSAGAKPAREDFTSEPFEPFTFLFAEERKLEEVVMGTCPPLCS